MNAWHRCASDNEILAETVLIGYDGSPDARRAVDVAAHLMAGASAVILHAWHVPLVPLEPAGPVMGRTAPPLEDEPFHEKAARRVAEEGATYASHAGLAAQFELRRAVSAHDIAETLLQAAEDHDAAVIVSGRRGMSRLKSALLGSVSDALVREARRPLLIVPSPDS